jgi:Ca2+-binding RTX toxin-like protein
VQVASTPVHRRCAAIAAIAGVLSLAVPLAVAQDPLQILGSDGPDVLNGTPGADAIYGRGGNDVLNGLGGNDDLDGGPGADALSGGEGDDSVSYSGAVAVAVTLNGAPDDGTPGEADNVGQDVEDIFGSDANDTLRGNAAANTIDGGAGNDVIDGGGGTDAIYGGVGDDIITARDGRVDRIECGPGRDRAIVDRVDSVKGCESVELTVQTPGFNMAGYPTRSRSRLRSVKLVGVLSGSRVVIACRSGCRPRTSRKRSLATRRSARVSAGAVRIALPARPAIVSATTFEVGVTGPRARHGRCAVFRVVGRFAGLPQVRAKHCISAARTT